MSQEAYSRRESPATPAARPVELHADLYREIFAHSKEAIAIIDPNGYYLQQNGAHYTMLGGLGEPQCYVSIERDITNRKRTEEKLAQLLMRERTARADAEKANRLK